MNQDKRNNEIKTSQVVAQYQELKKLGGYLEKEAQHAIDVFRSYEQVVDQISSPDYDWSHQNELLDTLNTSLSSGVAILGSGSIPLVATSGTALVTGMMNLTDAQSMIRYVQPDNFEQFKNSSVKLIESIDRFRDRDSLVQLIDTFHFPEHPGVKTPGSLVINSFEVFERNLDPFDASNVLIPIRSCIERIVDVLIHNRPHQEKASNWEDKIQSVLAQTAYGTISQLQITQIAQQLTPLMNELSESKDKTISRDQCKRVLSKAVLFLTALLQSIDQSKFR
jgi:hypothetical protein